MKWGWCLLTIALFSGCSPSEKPQVDTEAASVEAMRRLIERGHDAGEGSAGWGNNTVDGNSCSLVTPSSEDREEILGAEDARLLGQVLNLVTIRVLPNGGPSDAFWDQLGPIDSVLEFAIHYGLNEKGIRSLTKFPNLEIFTVWGGDSWGQPTSLRHLPPMPNLRILHVEESAIPTADFRHIMEMCPMLEEFLYDYELMPEDIEILRSIPTLKNISSEGFEMEDGKVMPG